MADQNENNQTVTWNSGGTTFDFLKVNVTDTASAAASLLQNFQVGGAVKWSVRKDGAITAAGGATIGGNSTITGTLGVTGAFTAAAIGGTTGTFSGDITLGTGTGAGIVKHPTDTGFTQVAGGTDGTSATLTLYGNTHATQANDIVFTAANSLRYQWDNSIGTHVWYTSGGTPVMSLDPSGNLATTGTMTASSGRKLKKHIKTLKDALGQINQMRGVSFVRKSDSAKCIGLVAEEVEKVYPELVVTDRKGGKSVAYQNVVAILIEAVKTLTEKVERLEAAK